MQVATSATGHEEEAQAAATGHEEAQATATGMARLGWSGRPLPRQLVRYEPR